jgi:hypothetical protein
VVYVVLDPFAKQVDFELHFSHAINVLLGGFHPLSFLLVLAYKKCPLVMGSVLTSEFPISGWRIDSYMRPSWGGGCVAFRGCFTSG